MAISNKASLTVGIFSDALPILHVRTKEDFIKQYFATPPNTDAKLRAALLSFYMD